MKLSSRRGFTLIEMLGTMVVMSMLLTVALDFYIDLSRQTTRATELTRGVRRANAILDRVASDLEHTLLVIKPDEVDPLRHPWLFLAEPLHAENGSDRLKFVRRVSPRSTDDAASDLAMVAYTLRRSEDDDESFSLYRWSTAELPASLDREFPLEGDPGDLLLADRITSFRVTFMDAGTGEWLPRWDSSLIEQSSRLPLAVEIEVGLIDEVQPDPDAFIEDEPRRYSKRISLPMRPIDLVALLSEEDQGEDGAGANGEDIDPDLLVSDCIGPDDVAGIAEAIGASVDEAEVFYARNQDLPWGEALAQVPGLAELGSCS